MAKILLNTERKHQQIYIGVIKVEDVSVVRVSATVSEDGVMSTINKLNYTKYNDNKEQIDYLIDNFIKSLDTDYEKLKTENFDIAVETQEGVVVNG